MIDEIETFENQMSRLADTLQQKAAQETTSLEDATNVFKALTAYYAILRKFKTRDDGGEDVTFGDLQDEVRNVVAEEATNGAASIRSRSRHT